MRVCLGDLLRTIDGDDAGTIEWMLIDPSSLRVKSVVIRRGLILRHSLVVPLSELEVRTRGNTTELVIRRARSAIDEFPEFRKELYTGELIQRLAGERASPFYLPGWIPPASLEEPPPPSPEVLELGEIVRTIDQANAVLHRGAAVVTAEGERVAHLHDLCVALPSGDLVSVRVRYGLPPHLLEIPVEAVSSADDGVLYLRWWRSDFERAAHSR